MNGGDDMHDELQPIDELAAAYALDALAPDERARFEAEASPDAHLEAFRFAETATHLSFDEVAPPTRMRASILDAIRAEPQESAGPVAAANESGVQASPLPVTSAPVGVTASEQAPALAQRRGPGPAERRARARWRPLRIVTAVAASAALLAGGIAIGTQLGGASQQEALGAVVAAGDAQRSEVELEGGATATVIWSAERAQSVLLFDGLEAAPHGHDYQAWYIDEAGPHSAGIFQTGGGSTAVLLEGQMDAGVAVGVTVEPEGGSEAPTTEPFLVVQT
ncbi:anti-sigma factor [Agrococcus sp. ARC_14]|uniref:anti-sigma factor n=1 Tax=Agrococcus sp. ARC_14 TaxID=2919927 RepID=UPI001F066E2B|nr:anti-sigma factor [Agrococcus sp. ARC_14]MCH1883430.1 anti-sigma factor [Agrococcus sp. ARC_14]